MFGLKPDVFLAGLKPLPLVSVMDFRKPFYYYNLGK